MAKKAPGSLKNLPTIMTCTRAASEKEIFLERHENNDRMIVSEPKYEEPLLVSML